MFRLLSYPMQSTDPVWPGNPPVVKAEAFSSIKAGEDANTTVLHLFSHSGTHLDAPKHFNDEGPAAVQLPVEQYVYFRPVLINIPKPDGGLIHLEEIEPYRERLGQADLVFLNTGWSKMRKQDPKRYVSAGPILHPLAASFLVDTFPTLKAIAIDAVSIGAPNDPVNTVKTHQILTGKDRSDRRFLLIFEDLRIDSDLDRATRIYAWPLFIEGSDGSPCTIVAEFQN
jgi:arylformamidase